MKRTLWLMLAATGALFAAAGADCNVDVDSDEDDNWFEDMFDDKAIVSQSQPDQGPLSFLA